MTDKNILPNYDLLVIPPSYYSVFEINCNADIEQQFKEIDVWLDNNKGAYKRTKWDNENEDYIIIWSGLYVIEKICEVWVPLENMLEGFINDVLNFNVKKHDPNRVEAPSK